MLVQTDSEMPMIVTEPHKLIMCQFLDFSIPTHPMKLLPLNTMVRISLH